MLASELLELHLILLVHLEHSMLWVFFVRTSLSAASVFGLFLALAAGSPSDGLLTLGPNQSFGFNVSFGPFLAIRVNNEVRALLNVVENDDDCTVFVVKPQPVFAISVVTLLLLGFTFSFGDGECER